MASSSASQWQPAGFVIGDRVSIDLEVQLAAVPAEKAA
jgi:hypothetical protein